MKDLGPPYLIDITSRPKNKFKRRKRKSGKKKVDQEYLCFSCKSGEK